MRSIILLVAFLSFAGAKGMDADIKAELFSPENGGKRMLKSWNGKYLSEGGTYCSNCKIKFKPGAYPITIHQNKLPGLKEQWTFEYIPERGEVALKGNDGRFLQHGPHDNDRMAAPGAAADEWEYLTPVRNADGSWSFRSRWGKWLSAHRGDNVEFMPSNMDCEQWWIE